MMPEIFWRNILGLQESFQLILLNWKIFLYLISIQGMIGGLLYRPLSRFCADRETLFVLSFSGGILGFNLISLFAVWLRIKPSPEIGWGILGLVAIAALWTCQTSWHLRPSLLFIVGIGTFFFFILLLRLIFIQELLVPPYADGIQHTLIVNDLLHPDAPIQAFYNVSLDFEHYYHLGFDSLAAWLSGTTQTEATRVIMLLGQYFQALAVISIYPLARILLKTTHAAWGTLLLAGLILPIPAYASNWAKYPTIASLPGIAFCLTIYFLLGDSSPRANWKYWLILFISTLSTFALHSRTAIVFLLSILLIVAFRKLKLESNFSTDGALENKLLLAISLLLIFLGVIVKYDQEILIGLYLWLFICSFTAFYANFKLTTGLLSMIVVLGAVGFIQLPMDGLPGKPNNLIDTPFFSIVLFFPASITFWLGIDGLIKVFTKQSSLSFKMIATRIALIFLLVIGLLNVSIQRNRPSDCCIFVKDDDVFSFEWLKKNIPDNTFVGVAATGKPGSYLPADGGGWIDQFTDIRTRRLAFDTDFGSETEKFCYEHITYFYLDDLENSFDEYSLFSAGATYQFGLGGVRIYQLNCKLAPLCDTHHLPNRLSCIQ